MRVERYTPEMRHRWDDFVSTSANATFLHRRDYMDYHADRFEDASLLVTDDSGHIAALLPANREGSAIVSHRGLTYGGLLLPRRHLPPVAAMEVARAIIGHYRDEGVKEIIYKPVPHIYHRYPSEIDVYAFVMAGARLESVSPSAAIALRMPRLHNESVRQAVTNALREGLTADFSSDFTTFYQMLRECLAERHSVAPVHSEAELNMLAGRFPDNIRLVAVTDKCGEMCGGVVLYVTDRTLHTQYIATTCEGRRVGAIPLAVDFICSQKWGPDAEFVDFGTSVEPSTCKLNPGLSGQKYSLGGRSVMYSKYHLNL